MKQHREMNKQTQTNKKQKKQTNTKNPPHSGTIEFHS
jgi:hypothetical protein